MQLDALYHDHVQRVIADAEMALAQSAQSGESFDGIVFSAGTELLVHRDDQPFTFRSDFHFARWTPLAGPDHLIEFSPGRKPRLLRVVPEDYWYEAPAGPAVRLDREFDVEVVASIDDALDSLGPLPSHAFVGFDDDVAEELEIPEDACEPFALMSALDWTRAVKSGFEVECLRHAASRAARGHEVVREGAKERRSELELHFDYLAATAMVEGEVPYPAIIGWDRHAAILHYQSKQVTAPEPGQVLLIDAGATVLGYASDVTRTYALEGTPALFVDLLDRMDRLQRELVDAVGPSVEYTDLHHQSHQGLAKILTETGLLTCSADAALERGLTLPFLPHGLGHHLGLQVHDVGGRQVDVHGNVQDPPEQYPHLRTTRPLDVGHVVTIEPGLYFIPLLLDPLRRDARGADVDWAKVDAMIPCGGIRIEDDVLVTENGREDLTRPHIPGHAD